ncbi:MAG: tetratricopeptide repeat protein [Nitrospirae bacterium]|nr:tetratricopeptide repeat protein [Candidatus Manganitrophaceae bacterium]
MMKKTLKSELSFWVALKKAPAEALRFGNIGVFFSLLVLAGCGGGQKNLNPSLLSEESLEERKLVLKEEVKVLRDVAVVSKKGEALRGYQALLARHPDPGSAVRAPALKRLGDLYMKEAHTRFLREMEAFEIDPSGPLPLVDYKQAIKTYTALLRDHHDYRENDQVLYALSRAYDEIGERDQALPLLEWLVKEYALSPYRLEASFRLGEYYFDRAEFEKAGLAYADAASWEDPFFQDKALYKLAWTHFNLKRYPEAIKDFLRVVDQKTEDMTTFEPEEGSLVWEALSYVSTSFRRLGGPPAVALYFQQNGLRPYEKDLYLMMGNHYMVEGEALQGIETYRAFIAVHPLAPMAPFFASYVIEALKKQGDVIATEAARIRLVQDYSSNSLWFKANTEADRARPRKLIKTELHRLALVSHAQAQKSKAAIDYRSTAAWYRQFLLEFPEDKDRSEIQFLLGETLMALEAYQDAGEAFEAAAWAGVNQDEEETPNRKAAYAAVVAFEKVKTVEGEKRFTAISLRFTKDFPKDIQAPIVLFNVAEFLFAKAVYTESASILGDFVTRYAKHKHIPAARKLIAHSYMKVGDFKKARMAYGEALSHLSKKNKKDQALFSDLMATAIYKEAEILKEKGEFAEAADLFQSVAREVPQSELAPAALFEAALLYEKREQPRDAIRVYRKLSQVYAKSPLAEKSYVHAGLLYEQLGERLQAAAVFAVAAKTTKDEAQAQKLLWNAAGYYEDEESWAKVIATFLSFIQRFPRHGDTPEALFKMAHAREKQGRQKAANKLYQSVIDRGPKTFFAAKARFKQAEHVFIVFKAIRLKAPFAKNLKKKTQALKNVVDLYSKAVQTGHVEVVTVSAFRLGEVFEHFQSAILEAERPKNLNAEQLEEYAFQLEEKAYPFEEKAIKAYESNVHRARQSIGLYNKWVKKSFERLATLRPSRYRRKERAERLVANLDAVVLPHMFSAESNDKRIAGRK